MAQKSGERDSLFLLLSLLEGVHNVVSSEAATLVEEGGVFKSLGEGVDLLEALVYDVKHHPSEHNVYFNFDLEEISDVRVLGGVQEEASEDQVEQVPVY